MSWHNLEVKEVFAKLKTTDFGLENKEVNNRLKKYGPNEIEEIKKYKKLKILFNQFKSILIFILLAATLFSVFIQSYVDAAVIFFVIVINTAIGFFQEYKSEEIIFKLKKSLKFSVIVLRDGSQKVIKSSDLVPGDILVLNEGAKVLADCRIIEQENLEVNEAILTGESYPIEKFNNVVRLNTKISERKNMIYAGTMIVKGKCKAIVVATGKETEFGKLAELVQETEKAITPLEKRINSFSKIVSVVVIVLVLINLVIGLFVGIETFEMILLSISMAVSAIPEGLPAVIAIILALAIGRMQLVNVLVKKLPIVETLGSTTIICTDKTGTLTEEELIVEGIYTNNYYSANNLKLDNDTKQLLKIAILCNNARIEGKDFIGDPTEVALVKFANSNSFDKKKITEKNIRIKEYAFDSQRKIMSIIRQENEQFTSYVKGAPNEIIKRCNRELINDRVYKISEKRRDELFEIEKEYAKKGLRVLGFAYTEVNGLEQKKAEENLIFSGFTAMLDPPRKEVKDAIKEALEAGIEIKIITGDSPFTTRTIASKIGLEGKAISGEELDKLNAKQFDKIVMEYIIFARVTPKQKLRIVEVLKQHNHTVAVTGDGINDLLALKKADIGIAMGIRGSDVVRDGADLVLLDDNFSSIINGIKEGRTVFENIKKAVKFLLATNVAGIFIVMFSFIIGLPLPLLPLAILWMNLVTDSLPALALGFEKSEDNIMKRKPSKNGLLKGIWKSVVVAGILNFIVCMVIFIYGLNFSLDIARTMIITTAIMFELFFVITCKSSKSIFKDHVFDNKYLIGAILVSTALHMIAVYTVLGKVFGFVPLTLNQLLISVAVSSIGLVVFEGWKLIKKDEFVTN